MLFTPDGKYLDVLPPRTSKGQTLDKIVASLALPEEEGSCSWRYTQRSFFVSDSI